MKLSSTAYGLLASWMMGNPFYIRYQITHRCNYGCRMCGQRQFDASTFKELTIDQIRVMAERLARMNARHVVITGGEPFMRKDLAEIIAAFKQHQFSIRVQTNGGPQVTYERMAECVAAGLNDISVSIDTLDKLKQDDICQRQGVVDHALKTLEYAKQLIPNGISQANVVASRFNFEELPDLVRYFYQRGIYTYITPVMIISEQESTKDGYNFRSQDNSFEIEGLSADTQNRVVNELIHLRQSGQGLTNSTKFLRDYLAHLLFSKMDWTCEAGRMTLDILPDGTVTVCKEKPPFGNVLDPDFETLFRSKDYREYAKKISTACSGCFYGEYREPQYAIRDLTVLGEWVQDWFRVFRFGMGFESKKGMVKVNED